MDNSFKLGDTVEMDGRLWVFVGMDGARAVILQAAGEPRIDAQRRIISVPTFHEAVGPSTRPGDFDLQPIDDDWPAHVAEMARHLRETIDGTPKNAKHRGTGAPRPQYDPNSTNARDRVAEKVTELSGTALARSESTIWRLRRAFRAGGMPALAEQMQPTRKQKLATAHVDPDVLAIIDDVRRELTDGSTINRVKSIAVVRRRARRVGMEIEVSDRTLRRWIDERVAGRHTFGKATTRRTAANSPDRAYTFHAAVRPGQLVEMDSTDFDLKFRGSDGRPDRPHLTLMWCVATAIPMAWAWHPEAAKGVDHAILLARAVVPRSAIPGMEATRLAASGVLPHKTMREINSWLDDDTLALPYIWPEEITVDGGMDFRSTVFADACLNYGITLNLAPPGDPTRKPHVERAFGTIKTGFAQYLAGFTGGDVTNSGKHKEHLWTLEALDQLFAMWVSTVYLNTPSEALRDPNCPDVLWTPNQRYASLFRVSAGLPIPFDEDDYIALMPTVKRTIRPDGIHYVNRVYDARALNDFRRLRSSSADGKWEIRYDPYNPAAVWLRHPVSGNWIECVDKALNWANAPFVADETVFGVAGAGAGPKQVPAAREAFLDHVELHEKTARREAARALRATNIPQPRVSIRTSPDITPADAAPSKARTAPVPGLGLIDFEEI